MLALIWGMRIHQVANSVCKDFLFKTRHKLCISERERVGYQYSLQHEIRTVTFYELQRAPAPPPPPTRNSAEIKAEEAWGKIMTNSIVSHSVDRETYAGILCLQPWHVNRIHNIQRTSLFWSVPSLLLQLLRLRRFPKRCHEREEMDCFNKDYTT